MCWVERLVSVSSASVRHCICRCSVDFQFLWWLCGLPCSGQTDSSFLSVKVTQLGRQSCTDGCNTVASDAEGLAIYDDDHEVLPLQLLLPKICTSLKLVRVVLHGDIGIFCSARLEQLYWNEMLERYVSVILFICDIYDTFTIRWMCVAQITSSWRVRRRWWPAHASLPPSVVSRASRGVELCAFTPSCVTSLPPTR